MNSRESLDDTPKWPKSHMLIYGTFGWKTQAERRFKLRGFLALGVMFGCVAAGFALNALHVVALPVKAMVFFPGILMAYVVWEWRRYLCSLDELARRMQFEAAAWTYATGLVGAMLLGALAVAIGWPHDSKLLFFWFVLLEPVRGAYLYLLSRRY